MYNLARPHFLLWRYGEIGLMQPFSALGARIATHGGPKAHFCALWRQEVGQEQAICSILAFWQPFSWDWRPWRKRQNPWWPCLCRNGGISCIACCTLFARRPPLVQSGASTGVRAPSLRWKTYWRFYILIIRYNFNKRLGKYASVTIY